MLARELQSRFDYISPNFVLPMSCFPLCVYVICQSGLIGHLGPGFGSVRVVSGLKDGWEARSQPPFIRAGQSRSSGPRLPWTRTRALPWSLRHRPRNPQVPNSDECKLNWTVSVSLWLVFNRSCYFDNRDHTCIFFTYRVITAYSFSGWKHWIVLSSVDCCSL